MSWRTPFSFDTADTTCSRVPLMLIGWSGIPMMDSRPTLISAPDCSIMDLICAPFEPMITGAEISGIMITKTPGSMSSTPCICRSFLTISLQAVSLQLFDTPAIVTILSARVEGVSPSFEMDTLAPEMSLICLMFCPPLPMMNDTASAGTRHR